MKKNFVLFFLAALLIASCNNTPATNDPDACSCAKEDLKDAKDAVLVKRCGELRNGNMAFEKEFQKCYIAAKAGLDSSQVKLSKMDSIQGMNLPAAGDGKYILDAAGTKVNWQAKKITGQHNGNLMVKSGDLVISNGLLSAATIVFDMTSITVGDQEGDSKMKLESHLKSEDFFSVEKNPEAKFVLKSATQKNKHQYEVSGDLTIKGITKPAKTSLIVVPSGDNMVNVSGGISIDRTLYDIRYGSTKFFDSLGDKAIDDVFFVTIDLKAKK